MFPLQAASALLGCMTAIVITIKENKVLSQTGFTLLKPSLRSFKLACSYYWHFTRYLSACNRTGV